jgi:hypothetical protein
MLSIDRKKTLQTATLKTVRAMRSVFPQLLRKAFLRLEIAYLIRGLGLADGAKG